MLLKNRRIAAFFLFYFGSGPYHFSIALIEVIQVVLFPAMKLLHNSNIALIKRLLNMEYKTTTANVNKRFTMNKSTPYSISKTLESRVFCIVKYYTFEDRYSIIACGIQ